MFRSQQTELRNGSPVDFVRSANMRCQGRFEKHSGDRTGQHVGWKGQPVPAASFGKAQDFRDVSELAYESRLSDLVGTPMSGIVCSKEFEFLQLALCVFQRSQTTWHGAQ